MTDITDEKIFKTITEVDDKEPVKGCFEDLKNYLNSLINKYLTE